LIPSLEQLLRAGWAFATYPEVAVLGTALLVWFALSCAIQAVLTIVLRSYWYVVPTLLVPLAGFLLLAYRQCPQGSAECQRGLGEVLATFIIWWAAIAWIVASMVGFFIAKPIYEARLKTVR
jgi:hypothetical protein